MNTNKRDYLVTLIILNGCWQVLFIIIRWFSNRKRVKINLSVRRIRRVLVCSISRAMAFMESRGKQDTCNF